MFFNLFKRKAVSKTEQELLKNIFKELGENYKNYIKQIDSGLLKGVFYQNKPFKNYVGFSYRPNLISEFEDKKQPYFVLEDIWAFEKNAKSFLEIRIYISFGVIVGYSTPEIKNPEFDIKQIQVDGYRKRFFENVDFEKVSEILDESELSLINSAEVYEVNVKDKLLYHIKDLGNGDFIGIDLNKKIYKITHDPFEILLLDKKLADVINNVSDY
jgi:hypothetical protein